eukprot:XP_011684217.1 PREDICTED: asialoglycoprotein receptor 2-like [Strongylocentrotus purpuratus]
MRDSTFVCIVSHLPSMHLPISDIWQRHFCMVPTNRGRSEQGTSKDQLRHVNGQICNTPGWLDFSDSQYLIVIGGRTWDQAKMYCQNQGGHLAIITSHEQTAFLVTYTLKASDGWNFWIGLHDQDGDGQYTWIDNTLPE